MARFFSQLTRQIPANSDLFQFERASDQMPRTLTWSEMKDELAPAVDAGYITGFNWLAQDKSLSINPGEAYIPGIDAVVKYAGGSVGGTIPNNSMLHLYLQTSGSVLASLTAPAPTAYHGTARHMTGNLNTRYLFSVRTRSSGNSLYVQRGITMGSAADVTFLHNVGVDGVLSNTFSSLSVTDMDCSPWAPADTTTDISLRVRHTAGTGLLRLYCYTGSGFTVFTNANAGSDLELLVPCDATPKFQADVTIMSTTGALWVMGFRMVR